MSKRDPNEVNAEIISGLDLMAEYQAVTTPSLEGDGF